MQQALIYMTQHAPTQRDKVILLLLRHTGARLHEILGMTAGGYHKALDPLSAFVVNKGSLGCEEKLITFLDTDEEELLKYIRVERASSDEFGRKQLTDLDDSDPLFLTARRQPYTDAAFRYHWKHLMEQVKKRYHCVFTPHTIRHLFVTQHLEWIKQEAADDKEQQQKLKAGLVQIMGWRSRATMEIYDHTFGVAEAIQKLRAFQKKAEQSLELEEKAFQEGANSKSKRLISKEPVMVIDEPDFSNAFVQLWEELA